MIGVIEKAIADIPYGPAVKNLVLNKLVMHNIDGMGFERLLKIRHRVGEIAAHLKTPAKISLCQGVLFVLNRYIDHIAPDHNCKVKDHVLSDHAFVNVLRRIHNLDVIALKNKAMHDIESSGYVPIRRGGHIVTILKKEWVK